MRLYINYTAKIVPECNWLIMNEKTKMEVQKSVRIRTFFVRFRTLSTTQLLKKGFLGGNL